jgi:cephalosporin hydroxylase
MVLRIEMIQGSSIDKTIVEKVKAIAASYTKVLVVLDSNHTQEHVLEELNFYSELVSKDSYIVVFDTIIEDLPDETYDNRPWGKGNDPKTAVKTFLSRNSRFEIDEQITQKIVITGCNSGYLKCIK